MEMLYYSRLPLFRPAAKQEDDEMVLQIVYVFHQLTAHPATRQLIIRDTRE